MKREQTPTERKFNKMMVDLSKVWTQYDLPAKSHDLLANTIFKAGGIRSFRSLSKRQRKWARDIVDDIVEGKIKKHKPTNEGKMETQTAMTIETEPVKKKRKAARRVNAEDRLKMLRLALLWICQHNASGKGDTGKREEYCRLIETSGQFRYADGEVIQWNPAPKAYTDGPAYGAFTEAKGILLSKGIAALLKEHAGAPILPQSFVDSIFNPPKVTVTVSADKVNGATAPATTGPSKIVVESILNNPGLSKEERASALREVGYI